MIFKCRALIHFNLNKFTEFWWKRSNIECLRPGWKLHEILTQSRPPLISGRHGGYLVTEWLRLRCYGSGVSGPGRGSEGGWGCWPAGETQSHMSCLVSAPEASHFTVYFINPPDRNISPLPSLLLPCVLVELSSIIRRVKLNKRLNPNFCLLYLLNK